MEARAQQAAVIAEMRKGPRFVSDPEPAFERT